MINLILFGSFFVMLLLNIPIAVSLGMSSIFALLFSSSPLTVVPTNVYSGMAKFLLLAIPFFVLSGNIMAKAGAMLDKLGIDQPKWSALTSMEDVQKFIDEVGYPVLVRPSYVLSGAAMNVCHNDDELRRFLEAASEVSKEYPVVISQFMTETNEIEFDGVAQNGEIVEYGISEHVEYAGVHSGDATMTFPAQQISFATARQIKKISRAIAKELNISGPFNIQYLAKGRDVKVIECNLRASRSFPFVSKVLKRNFIETATRIMLDAPYQKPDKSAFDIDRMGVKASQFSFARLQNALECQVCDTSQQ